MNNEDKEIAPILPDKPHPGRTAKCICIIGKPGSGKSTVAVELMKAAGTGLFLQPQPDNWSDRTIAANITDRKSCNYTGIKHYIYRSDDDFGHIYRNFHNAMICMDDCRAYVPANFEYSQLRLFLLRRRQRMLDVIFTAHGFSEIPPRLFTFITDYIIMPIGDTPEVRKKDITNPAIYSKLCETVREVNEKGVIDDHFNKWIRVQ